MRSALRSMRSKVGAGRTSFTPTIWRSICGAGGRRSPAASRPYPRLASATRTASTGGCCITPSRCAMNTATSFGGLARASTSKNLKRAEETIRERGAGAPDDSRDDPGLRLDGPARWRSRVHHRELVPADGSHPRRGPRLGVDEHDSSGRPRPPRAGMAGGDRRGTSPRCGNARPRREREVSMAPDARRSAPRRNGRDHPVVRDAHGHRRPQARGTRAAQAERSAPQGEHRAPRRDHPDLDVRGDRRLFGAAAPRSGARGEGGEHGFDGADHRRDRHRKRADRPRHSQAVARAPHGRSCRSTAAPFRRR